ncbi:hypothetical protein [Cognatishimia sp.]|uniref:hypothetical protein n=1 Tax=Cognatishimia sp. TaxID=2211648 RepID=UPI00351305EF|nr:hypothetical protein [Cognatishimia sp.]
MHKASKSLQTQVSAYPGEVLEVTEGANLGDRFSVSGDLCLGDAYELCDNGLPVPLQRGHVRSAKAKPGDMALDCALTLMSDKGQHVSAQLFATLDTQGCVKKTHLRTDMLLQPKTPYVLVDIRR